MKHNLLTTNVVKNQEILDSSSMKLKIENIIERMSINCRLTSTRLSDTNYLVTDKSEKFSRKTFVEIEVINYIFSSLEV